MTIPKKMIEAGCKALLETNPDRFAGEYLVAYVEPVIQAALATMWSDDMEKAPDEVHYRALWVRVQRGGQPAYGYWDAYLGCADEETGEWVCVGTDDCGWSIDDFTHWMPSLPPTIRNAS